MTCSELIDYGCCRHEVESKDMCQCGCDHVLKWKKEPPTGRGLWHKRKKVHTCKACGHTEYDVRHCRIIERDGQLWEWLGKHAKAGVLYGVDGCLGTGDWEWYHADGA